MVINARTSMATQAAPSHAQNQDTLRMLNLRLRHANPSWVWVISDGMGGHLRGEQASHITVQVFLDHFLLSYFDSVKFFENSVQYLEKLVSEIDIAVYDLGFSGEAFHRDPHRNLMGATMTGALLVDQYLYLVHLGDTRCYLMRDGSLTLLTVDHVTENGEFLTQALGSGDLLDPFITKIKMEKRDMLVFLSDGVHKVLRTDEILNIVATGSDLEQIAGDLVKVVTADRRFADDVSALVVSFS